MAEGSVTLKVVKVPAWMKDGIDIKPYTADALDSIGAEIEKRTGKGLGAKRNQIVRERSFFEQRVFTTLTFPRTKGTAYQRNQTGRFNGMAPRVVKKYIVAPLEALWARTVAA